MDDATCGAKSQGPPRRRRGRLSRRPGGPLLREEEDRDAVTLRLDAVEGVLRWAGEDAQRRRHSRVTVEHLLRAVLADGAGARLLLALGAEPLALVEELERHLTTRGPRRRFFSAPGVSQDAALSRLLERAILGAMGAGKEALQLGDLLAALYQEPEGTALRLLRARGVERLHLLRYLSHGLPRAAPAPVAAGPGAQRVILHNDDYTTMDFVVMILETVFDHGREEARRIMGAVHNLGRGVAGTYPGDLAVIKVSDVRELSEQAQFPLHCTLEPE